MNPNESNQPTIGYMSFNTPPAAAAESQCGRAGFADLHSAGSTVLGGGDSSDPAVPFPMGCLSNGMNAEQLALEFLLFDLGACIQPEGATPLPPPTG